MTTDSNLAVGFMEKPYQVVRANSGGIRFSVVNCNRRQVYCLHLLSNKCNHRELYSISLSMSSMLVDQVTDEEISFTIPNFHEQHTHDFWLTWFNDVICLGKLNEPAILTYPVQHTKEHLMIGFVKFETCDNNGIDDWNIESIPVICTQMTVSKKVIGGELKWISMTSGDTLPTDALIGGFEDEPLYIAKAAHRSSSCPGKYVKSQQIAYVPWGGEEYSKTKFMILCGYDAVWVKCMDGCIPENAFIGGYSEVNNEPLFIGRGRVGNNLIVGKVHMLYKTCYLPFKGKEVERCEYEILVIGNAVRRSKTNEPMCLMKMIMQPCLNQKEGI